MVITKKQLRAQFGGRTIDWIRKNLLTDAVLASLEIKPEDFTKWRSIPPIPSAKILRYIKEETGVELELSQIGQPVRFSHYENR